VILAVSLDPKTILDSLHPYGEVGLWLMVFAETGLLIGFFLPGDSLLFTAGLLASQGSLDATLVILGCFVAAVIGDAVGYTIGRQVGPCLFARPDSKVFKQAYVERTSAFFDRHGPKTVLLARFVPVVRTFTPVMAGVGGMRRRTFTIYNVIGALIWAVGITLAGYALSSAIGSSIDTYLYPIIAAIVVLSLIPPLLEWRRTKRAQNAAEAPDAER
jgi:membrane-associated protein